MCEKTSGATLIVIIVIRGTQISRVLRLTAAWEVDEKNKNQGPPGTSLCPVPRPSFGQIEPLSYALVLSLDLSGTLTQPFGISFRSLLVWSVPSQRLMGTFFNDRVSLPHAT